jgi:hypothetical protein
MEYQLAERLLRSVHYKPGWSLECWRDRSGRMTVDIRARVKDSSDFPYYDRNIQAGGVFGIDLTHVNTSEEFYRIVLDNIIAWETHEAREFFRVGPSYSAPFHPHTTLGNNRWQNNAPAEAVLFAAA